MNERMKFITRLEDGERMTELCREFGISRVTGHKLWKRYLERGIDGLFDESKVPYKTPHKTNEIIENKILKLKDKYKTWGAQKLREFLIRKYPTEKFPSVTTFHNILLKNDLVKKRRRKKYKAQGTNLKAAKWPNDLWCTDFKGEFKLQNKNYCYPLTISDHSSRYLINCTCLESIKTAGAISSFREAFEEYGLPNAIRSDNGVPFSAPNAILGLSHLSVWWLRLGINIERIRPGCPQENGQHERMHRTLKEEIKGKIKSNILAQQEIMDNFKDVYNNQRPHQGIENKVPSDLFKKSKRIYPKQLPDIEYKGATIERELTKKGVFNYGGKEIAISSVLAKQPVGLYQIGEGVMMMKFMDLVLGHLDEKTLEFSAVREFIKIEV